MKLNRGPWSGLRWRTRAILWTFSAMAGLIVVLFAKMADAAMAIFFMIDKPYPWAALLLTPFVGMLTVWATIRYFPGSQGSGIPQVIAATKNSIQHKPVNGLISLRIAFGKVMLGAFALVGGFSSGREGPSVQVASSILHFSHRFFPHSRAIRESDMILAGGAAGIAAAFNTPLAGIVFAVEELGRRLEARTSGVLISTIILSGLVSIALLGNYNYFGRISVTEVHLSIMIPIMVCGIFCGLLGGLLSKLLLWPQQYPDFVFWKWRANHPVLFAGLCGLLVAVIGLMVNGASFGSGYLITRQLVNGEVSLTWYAPLARYLAILLTYFSGIPGGIFSPSLSVGASIGSSLSVLFSADVSAASVITLCMAAFLAAVTQSPITSAIIVMEMVDGHGMLLSLMAVTLIAKAVSSRISTELYQQLAKGFLGPQ